MISSSVLTYCLLVFIPYAPSTFEFLPLWSAAAMEPSSIAGVYEYTMLQSIATRLQD